MSSPQRYNFAKVNIKLYYITPHHCHRKAQISCHMVLLCLSPSHLPLLGLGKLESGYLHNTTRARQLAWSGDKQQPRRVKMHQNNKSVSDWRNISTSPSPPSTQYLPPTTLLLAASSARMVEVKLKVEFPLPHRATEQ